MTVYNADAGDARRDDWGTPQWLFDWCAHVWGPFDMDVAASAENAKMDPFIDAEGDALLHPWEHSNFLNPPFSLVSAFTERAALFAEAGSSTLMILPASTDTKWFHRNVFLAAAEIVFLEGRIGFVLDGKEINNNNAGTVLAFYAPRSYVAKPSIWRAPVSNMKIGLPIWDKRGRQTSILDRMDHG